MLALPPRLMFATAGRRPSATTASMPATMPEIGPLPAQFSTR
jgi:hypothetical protein